MQTNRRFVFGFVAIAALCLPLSACAQSDFDTFTAAFDRSIPANLNEFRVPGAAIAIIRNGEVAFVKGYGYADAANKKPVTPQTGFNIGSISKTVAAWGVMKLVEQGKLGLDTPVDQYLTRWHLPTSQFNAKGVTVRRLLSHTAGLSLHGYPGFGPDDKLPTVEASLSGATNGSGDVRLVMEPGTKWQYSGGGFTLSQLLVEELTKKRFSDYMLEEVLKPLGMNRSNYELTPEILAGSSVCYNSFGEVTPNPRFTAQAAAGLHTTLEDLATFAVAVLKNRNGKPGRGILKEETISIMTSPAPTSDGAYGLGYGIDTVGTSNLVGVGHGGANRGWHSFFLVVPATGDGFVMVTNGSNGFSVYQQARCDWNAYLTGTRAPCLKPLSLSLLNTALESGADAAVKRYADLKQTGVNEYHFDEFELNQLGYILLQNNRTQDAITIFKLNVQEYPEASNPYDSLGEAYMTAGNKGLAIKNYKKSLELDTKNENAVAMLKKLTEANGEK